MKPVLDALIAAGTIDPLVVVWPRAHMSQPDFGIFGNRHMFVDSERNGAWGSMVSVDLPDYMAANYNVVTDRIGRAVGGFSMGADGAVYNGLRNNGQFTALLAHATAAAINYYPNLVASVVLVADRLSGHTPSSRIFPPTVSTMQL